MLLELELLELLLELLELLELELPLELLLELDELPLSLGVELDELFEQPAKSATSIMTATRTAIKRFVFILFLLLNFVQHAVRTFLPPSLQNEQKYIQIIQRPFTKINSKFNMTSRFGNISMFFPAQLKSMKLDFCIKQKKPL